MWIEDRPCESIEHQRHSAKDPLVQAALTADWRGTLPTRWIDSEVIDCFFVCVPRKLESSQTIVFTVCASEMEFFDAGARQKLYPLPHDKIVRAEFLKVLVRSGVLVNGILSKAEEDCRGNWARCALRKNDEA